ncbi:MAG: peptidoglycan DD-metalloendopeptidase family protein, partial [Sphingomonadales bacterium]
ARPVTRPAPPTTGSPPAGQSFAALEGKIPMPASGPVVRTFGQHDDLGNPSRGIMIETRTGAQVTAPHDGQVVFAGPFRNYGQILIISHGEGYHTLLAGMSRISGVVGQWVLAGEPVGVMGSDSKTNAGGDAAPSSARTRLYVELRRNGKPVNPLRWLVSGDGKVSG